VVLEVRDQLPVTRSRGRLNQLVCWTLHHRGSVRWGGCRRDGGLKVPHRQVADRGTPWNARNPNRVSNRAHLRSPCAQRRAGLARRAPQRRRAPARATSTTCPDPAAATADRHRDGRPGPPTPASLEARAAAFERCRRRMKAGRREISFSSVPRTRGRRGRAAPAVDFATDCRSVVVTYPRCHRSCWSEA